jgi:hypothetical protein
MRKIPCACGAGMRVGGDMPEGSRSIGPSYSEELKLRRAVSGADHPDTLRSIADLAGSYHNQGRYGEAEKSSHKDQLTQIAQRSFWHGWWLLSATESAADCKAVVGRLACPTPFSNKDLSASPTPGFRSKSRPYLILGAE